ncbi:MAG: TonB-dependent receptor [Ignavibacteriae bacterium]|nr:TonB-dependent receptor [Ignavibacteriota bacterium]
MKEKVIKFVILIIFLSGIFTVHTFADDKTDKDNGIIYGKVIDNDTKKGIYNVLIKIINSEIQTLSDKSGEFKFENIKYNTYRLEISVLGYKSKILSDVVVSSGKPLVVVVELNSTNITTEDINVEANYFQKNSDVNISSLNLDYEEVRRSPGAAEDISRMLQTAPGVSLVNDQRNDLIVRGGSPSENLFLIDGIEIPNINHYGSQGTTGGPIGFINLKFIREADIYTGGFISKYGDKLSSVVDIKFRDGSKTNYINNVDFNMAGFGGLFEGPISKKSSYLFSIRRSYLDLLKSAIRLTAVPNYWDMNLKLDYKFDNNNMLSLIGFGAIDKINLKADENTSVNDWPYNSDDRTNTYTAGLNYTKLFNKGYLQTVLSNSYTDYYDDIIFATTGKREYYNDSYENTTNLKLDLNYKLNKYMTVNFGAGWKYITFKNDMFAIADTTPEGYPIPEMRFNSKLNANKYYSSVNLTSKLFNEKIILNTGVRVDYFDYIRLKSTFSPRFGISYKVLPTTSINASFGIFNQTPEYIWIASNQQNKNLNSIKCEHYVLGVEHLFTSSLNAIVEVYEKRYNGYPVSIDDPRYILIDGGANYGPNLVGASTSAGSGYVRGLDISLQKKLTGNGFYGLITYSYSKSGFTALAGGEKPAAFDPTNQFTIIAGYQVADDWLIGVKFKYAGGRPYTPFNVEKSKQLGRGVWEMDKFNGERYIDYHRLDLRVDKKFYYKMATITAYLELQNVYNRENVFGYFWNKAKNDVGTVYQWAFMPVGGFSLQF